MKQLLSLMACLFMLASLPSCTYVGNRIGKKHSADVVQKKLTPGGSIPYATVLNGMFLSFKQIPHIYYCVAMQTLLIR